MLIVIVFVVFAIVVVVVVVVVVVWVVDDQASAGTRRRSVPVASLCNSGRCHWAKSQEKPKVKRPYSSIFLSSCWLVRKKLLYAGIFLCVLLGWSKKVLLLLMTLAKIIFVRIFHLLMSKTCLARKKLFTLNSLLWVFCSLCPSVWQCSIAFLLFLLLSRLQFCQACHWISLFLLFYFAAKKGSPLFADLCSPCA